MALFTANFVKRKDIRKNQIVGEPLKAVAITENFGDLETAGPGTEESVPHEYLGADLQRRTI